MKKYLIGAVTVMVIGFTWAAQASSIRPLTEQEKANLGATHEVTITHADLTLATTNSTQTNALFAVTAKQGVELIAMVLKTPFTYSATNAYNSVTMTVGDGTDDDLYLTSTELNSYGTEVYLKYGRNQTTLTPTTSIYSNVVYNNSGSTGTITTVSYTVTDGTIGKKLYTAADTIDFFISSMAGYSLAELDAGEVRIYLKVTDATK